MKKSHIAVLVSLLFAVPAGMVALAQSGSATTETVEVVAVPAEPVVVTEQVAVVTDQSAQPVVIAESTTVAIPVEVVVQPKQMSIAEWQRINSFRTDEVPMLPRQIAYYERLESQRGPLMASSAVAGANGEDEFKLSPAQTAFFDRAEQQRLARLQPQQPVAAIEIQSPSQEVVIADSSAIR